MNNKRELLYVFSILIIFGLIFNFVSAQTHLSSTSTIAVSGDGYAVDNWTKGGINATVNFTLVFGTVPNVITNISIAIPTTVTVGDLAQASIEGPVSGAGGRTNATYSSTATWDCYGVNLTDNGHPEYIDFWECINSSGTGQASSSTFEIGFNFTANSTGTEEPLIWKVYTTNESGYGKENQFSTNIDNLAPRLIELNVSDGYTSLGNGTSSLGLHPNNLLFGDIYAIDNGTLRNVDTLTVTATFEENNFTALTTMTTEKNVYLYYNTQLTNNSNITDIDFEKGGGSGGIGVFKMTTSDTVSPYKFRGVITGLSENNITTFVLVANDTFNNIRYQNNTDDSAAAPFAVLINSTNVPILTLNNISDGTGGYNISESSGKYLRPGTQTFTVTASGRDLFGIKRDRNLTLIGDVDEGVILYYNTTGNLTTDVNGLVSENDAQPVILVNNSESGYSAVYTGSISIQSDNDTNTLYYAIVANTTNGTYYTLLTGQYVIDNLGPISTAITSDDADDRIVVGNSVTFTCSASDAGVGVNSMGYVWKINYGGTDTSVEDQTDSTLTLTSSSSYATTGKAGDYTAKCTPYDSLGHAGTEASRAYTITASTGGGTSTGGGGGSATTITFDADLSTASSASVSGSVGRIKSFSFDGKVKHTVTFKEITATSAKITIASTPIDVVLNVGESKKVDINADGVDDLEVTLDKVKFGTTAEITMKKLVTGAQKVVEEEKEVPATEEPTLPTEAQSKGMGWLVTTLLVIVILVVIGYYAFKKK